MKQQGEYEAFERNFGKGISNEIRFKLLTALSKGPMTVSELVTVSGAQQATVSQHLSVLKNGHLITGQKQGQYVVYSLNFDYLLTGLKGITHILEQSAPREAQHE